MKFKRIAQIRWVQALFGLIGASYLRFVNATSRWYFEPADIYSRVEHDLPVILAMWHGQHFLMPFVRKPHFKAKVLISPHGDGEVNALAARRLGVEAIRGSGDRKGKFYSKGAISGFAEMVSALADGYNVAMTSDFPKIARVAGLGTVMLARASGRPIYTVAIASSRRIELRNWDRTSINLPFSRIAVIVGEPVSVAADADKSVLEQARLLVEQRLNAATAKAYSIVDGSQGVNSMQTART